MLHALSSSIKHHPPVKSLPPEVLRHIKPPPLPPPPPRYRQDAGSDIAVHEGADLVAHEIAHDAAPPARVHEIPVVVPDNDVFMDDEVEGVIENHEGLQGDVPNAEAAENDVVAHEGALDVDHLEDVEQLDVQAPRAHDAYPRGEPGERGVPGVDAEGRSSVNLEESELNWLYTAFTIVRASQEEG